MEGVFGASMHAKRVLYLANATLGTMHAEFLAIHLIGQGLAQAKDLERKHCIILFFKSFPTCSSGFNSGE